MGRYSTEVANQSDVVLTIVGYPKDVEEVYFGEQGIFKSTKEHLVVVDPYNKVPTLAKRIAEEAASSLLGSSRCTCIRWGPWC